MLKHGVEAVERFRHLLLFIEVGYSTEELGGFLVFVYGDVVVFRALDECVRDAMVFEIQHLFFVLGLVFHVERFVRQAFFRNRIHHVSFIVRGLQHCATLLLF